jgi:hypothetical protein
MIGQYSKSEWAVVGNSGVIVGLPGRNQSHPEIGGDNACYQHLSESITTLTNDEIAITPCWPTTDGSTILFA